jgi:hypothetical protein
MTIRATFAKLAHYLHEFSKGNAVFLKKGFWRMCTFWRGSPQSIWQVTGKIGRRFFWKMWVLAGIVKNCGVLAFTSFTCEWPLLIFEPFLSSPNSLWKSLKCHLFFFKFYLFSHTRLLSAKRRKKYLQYTKYTKHYNVRSGAFTPSRITATWTTKTRVSVGSR